jgi:hypothetical protein
MAAQLHPAEYVKPIESTLSPEELLPRWLQETALSVTLPYTDA